MSTNSVCNDGAANTAGAAIVLRSIALMALVCAPGMGCTSDPQQGPSEAPAGSTGGGPSSSTTSSASQTSSGAPAGSTGAASTGMTQVGGVETSAAASTGTVAVSGSGGTGNQVTTGGAMTTSSSSAAVSSGGAATGAVSSDGSMTASVSSGGAVTAGGSTAGAQNEFRVYLLIGQSNMAGGAETEPGDLEEDERIRVLGYDDCAATGRAYNEWDTASPPLHACWSEGIGPGDHFAKTLIEALPAGDTIGLVPCAIPGVDIDFFVKGVVSARRGEFTIPPDNHWDSAYDWVLERAILAQDAGGVIDGVIFHQGESDSGEPNRSLWADKVAGIVADLRTDLGGAEFPLVVGELLYDGCCGSLNTIVNQLPSSIPNTYVASAADLNGVDQFHFDAPGVRTLGQRYGEAMIEALGLNP